MYVYILTNPAHTVLYIGVTNDLNRRLAEHSAGLGDDHKFTGHYQCNLLIYFEHCADASQAIAREKQLKGWTRAKKEALIAGLNPGWEAIDLETWHGGLEDTPTAFIARLQQAQQARHAERSRSISAAAVAIPPPPPSEMLRQAQHDNDPTQHPPTHLPPNKPHE